MLDEAQGGTAEIKQLARASAQRASAQRASAGQVR